MTGPLAILHCAAEYQGGGSTVSITLLAATQQRDGHRVVVACPADSALAVRAAASGLEVVPFDFESRGAPARLAALARAHRADVVNAHASRDRDASRRARFAGRLTSALVMTRRVMPRSTWLSALASGLAADRTIAVSRPVAAALIRAGTPAGRVRVVHNAVDAARLAPPPAEAVVRARARAGADGDRPVLGVVARRKDQDVLLAALPYLPRPVIVCCVGIAPDERLTRLAGQAERRGHRVTFVPFELDVRPFYDVFDVAVLPSRHEGLSQAVLEAMYLGVPVVATRAGGNPDAVTDGVHGLLVPPRDPVALASAIAQLLADAALRTRVADAARARVAEAFTAARTVLATDAVYREAVRRRRVA